MTQNGIEHCPLMTISEPKEKARLALHNGNPETYVGQAFMLTAEWGVAPMNWPHFYRVITTDGNGERHACGDPIFAPEGYWTVLDALAIDIGIKE